jgi:hypothetical protein
MPALCKSVVPCERDVINIGITQRSLAELRLLSNPEWSIRCKRYYQKSVPSALYQGGGNARRCHTLCKSTVLGAAFLAGLAIAANADPASTSAAGTVANGVSGSQPQGRGLAALPKQRPPRSRRRSAVREVPPKDPGDCRRTGSRAHGPSGSGHGPPQRCRAMQKFELEGRFPQRCGWARRGLSACPS